jgi:RNA polymerase sigma-70 factor, ECF subfamily
LPRDSATCGEVQVLKEAGSDDRQAKFLARFLPTQKSLRAFIRSCLSGGARCDDVFQEAALVLWREFDKYDPARPFGPWARGVAAKTVLRTLRQGRQSPIALSPEAIAALERAFAAHDGSDAPQSDALQRCLDRLPVKTRALLQLRYRESMSLAEIATRIRGSTAAVHKALTRARAALRSCVERRLRAGVEGT